MNIAGLLADGRARAGRRLALVQGPRSLTYQALSDRMARLAAGLAGLGLRRGDSPEATAATLAQGWLHTGDIGHLEAGYLHLTDRAKDVISHETAGPRPAVARPRVSPINAVFPINLTSFIDKGLISRERGLMAGEVRGSIEDTAMAFPVPVPVIDLAATVGPGTSVSVLEQVRVATETTGVILVVNHGISLDLVGQLGDPELRDLTCRFIAAGQSLAERVLSLYARAHGLPEGTFPVDPLPYLSLASDRHPAGPGPDGESVLTVPVRPGGHADLQLQRPDRSWRPVPAGPGALPVFSGRLLSEWTSGLLRPARVRAVPGRRHPAAVLTYPSLGPVRGPLASFAQPRAVTVREPVTQWDLVHYGMKSYQKAPGRPVPLAAGRP